MIKRRLIIAVFVLIVVPALHAQEVLTGLPVNYVVERQALKMKENVGFKSAAQRQASLLTLPFFDDFTTSRVFPDHRRWVERATFINNSFSYLPPNQWVATFDALDSTGNIYGSARSVPFKADRLTSQPLRLDSVFVPTPAKLSPADSLYLSFYYQPQGMGDAPEPGDSLVLAFRELTGDTVFSHIDSVWVSVNNFLNSPQDTLLPGDTLQAKAPCDTSFYLVNYKTLVWGDSIRFPCDSVSIPGTAWRTVWKVPGMTLKAFQKKYGKDFVEVMVPIRDSAYFYKGFQFRFFNYASIANNINPGWKSNVDEWNLDYVYLNAGRSAADTTHRAIGFSGRNPVFLKHYTQMPYRQYRSDPTNSLTPDFHVYIDNLDKINHKIHYYYKVSQVNGSFAYGYDGGNSTLPPFYQSGFQNCNSGSGAAQACPPVNSLFSLDYDRDTTSYLIRHYISDSSVSPPLVDSMVYRQGFYNEYAYDDGVPEMGYALEPAGAELAYRFKINVADTLRALRIYFNKIKDAPSQFFDLLVWRDNKGKPGEMIYRQKNIRVQWDKGIYPFFTYRLDTPVMVSGTFYVGYQQQNQSLNVGFDTNHDAGNDIFYFADNQWYKTNFTGALLMRPVVGQDLIMGTGQLFPKRGKAFDVYPNPAYGRIRFSGLDLTSGAPAEVVVYNLLGTIVSRQTLHQNEMNIRFLSNGMYLLRIKSGNRIYHAKFIVKH
ncbi:MAG: hypothetical protein IEMM0006_1618 [bacterium]|nr:MAG: hypothetical protein IEMM0006_1618 [bacterium]